MKIQIINESKHKLPSYATECSAGMDLYADIENGGSITVNPMGRELISTGLRIALPKGYEAQIRPRSGLAIKHGITVLNTPGTIDADYRGVIKVILINLSNEPFIVKDGERIGQMVISKYENAEWEEVDSLDETERGEGGFGHTGMN